MKNIFFFGYLPDPATKLQLIIEVLNYNTLIVDAVIVTTILWLLYIIALIGYVSKVSIDDKDFWFITEIIFKKGVKIFKLKENKVLEFIWTIIPALIILAIMIPSIIATYISEVVISTLTPVKIIGNQWFWTSEHTILKSEKIVIIDGLHLLKNENTDVFLLVNDKPIVVPVFNRIPFIVTSNDVIHSFALPECGIKIDAVPGRLNQVFTEFIKIGNYTGMCSELCGVGHAKMPINVSTMSVPSYLLYTDITTKISSNNLLENTLITYVLENTLYELENTLITYESFLTLKNLILDLILETQIIDQPQAVIDSTESIIDSTESIIDSTESIQLGRTILNDGGIFHLLLIQELINNDMETFSLFNSTSNNSNEKNIIMDEEEGLIYSYRSRRYDNIGPTHYDERDDRIFHLLLIQELINMKRENDLILSIFLNIPKNCHDCYMDFRNKLEQPYPTVEAWRRATKWEDYFFSGRNLIGKNIPVDVDKAMNVMKVERYEKAIKELDECLQKECLPKEYQIKDIKIEQKILTK